MNACRNLSILIVLVCIVATPVVAKDEWEEITLWPGESYTYGEVTVTCGHGVVWNDPRSTL